MKNHWKEALVFSGVVLLAGLLIAIFLGDSGDEPQEKAKPTTTTTTIPNIDSVEEGPYQDELLEIARHFDLEPYGDNWRFSIVTDEVGATINVKTGRGRVALYTGGGKDTEGSPCHGIPPDFLPGMVDKGDAIVWSNKGGDLQVCPGEIYIVATASEVKQATR